MVPVVDGKSIPDLPVNIRQRGEFANVPLMIGYTQQDSFEFSLLRD